MPPAGAAAGAAAAGGAVCGTATAIATGVGAAASLAGGVATALSSNKNERPKAAEPFPLSSDQTSVAGTLASSFNQFSKDPGHLGGQPSLGQGLTGSAGALNSTQSLRDRLASVGSDLNSLVGARPTTASNAPPPPSRPM